MIEYIVNKNNQACIYQTDQLRCMNVFNLTVIKNLCMNHLFTYEGYLKAVKKALGYQYRIPLYINESLQMISTRRVRDYENIWINYASVSSITYIGNRVSVTFTSHRILEIEMTQYAYREQIKRLTAIKFHISKHFHD